MSLEIKQSATYKGGDRWDWSVWVDGTKAELEKVKSVTYRLHETFPDPVRVRTSRSEKFRLDSSGWGEFTILVNIDAGGKKIIRRHYLKLEESKIAQPQAATEPVSVYLCYAASDKRIASGLERGLRASDLNVTNAGQIAGSSFRVALAESLKSIDVVVAVVSEYPSDWVLYEIGLAQNAGVPVIVVAEDHTNPPSDLAKLPVLRVSLSADPELEKSAPDLVGMVRSAATKRKR
jgi:hypothetical protein